MSNNHRSDEPELHVFESDRGRFVLTDGSDAIATVAALVDVDESQLSYLRDETREQNRARLEELRQEATSRALPPYEFQSGVCPICDSHDVQEIVYGYLIDDLEAHQVVGGCCVSEDYPDFVCGACRARWGEGIAPHMSALGWLS